MESIKQSICFWPFIKGDLSPKEIITAAAEIGYRSVEMAEQKYWPMIFDQGLGIAIF